MLKIIQGNRLETLAEGLARELREAPLPPLTPETIVVQSDGIARWLKLVLADRLGIAAGVRFTYPARHVWELIARVVPGVPTESPLAPELLKWRIAAALPVLAAERRFAALARYLDAGDALMAYQLAERLAAVFDRYLVYRPDWIAAWSVGAENGLGPDEAWQAALWREVRGGLPEMARADPQERFRAALARDASAARLLPARLHLFAVEALPPVYLETFRGIAAHSEVRLWLMNPCREYWPLIDAPRRVARARAEAGPEAAHRETGNRLLASLGRHGRALIDALTEDLSNGPGTEGASAFFDDPACDSPESSAPTLLAALQSDVLNLRERGDEGAPHLAREAADGSLSVQICHSATREIEVLHDRLLDRFERDPTLRPADVLVLMPDVAAYAPIVEAVFGTAPRARRIPYAIADRMGAAGSETIRAFHALLALPDGRLEAEQLLALLEAPVLARRFGIAAGDLATVRAWVDRARIRWGADESTRVRLGLPPGRAHSWRAGFERLFLGYAMAAEASELFAEVLPVPGVEGGDAALAARLARFAESVFALERELCEPRPLAAWSALLGNALDAFLAPDEAQTADALEIRAALDRMAGDAEASGFGGRVPIAVVRAHLQSALALPVAGRAFFAGGVTFAAIAPARPVPARLVCLVGMNDGSFPRDERPPGFDLTARFPRRGDRVRRDEDRYAVLNAVIAARQTLYVSYTGRSVRDNKPLPPSPLVSELLDAVRRALAPAGRDAAMRAIVVEQPLQPFSRRYGAAGERLFTYAEEYAQRTPPPPLPRFAGRMLATSDAAAPVVTLAALVRFLANPARHFFERRLGLRLEAAGGPIEGAEPFSLTELAGWEVDQRAFELRRAGRSLADVRRILRGAGLVPDGAAGDAALVKRLADVEPIVAALDRAAPGEPIEAELALGATRLALRLEGITPEGGLAWRVGRLRAVDRLRAWVEHLALVALAPDGVAPRTRLLARRAKVTFEGAQAPHARLANLLELYAAGEREPVPFFPETALAFATAARGARAGEIATAPSRAAADKWDAERDADAYLSLAFRDAEPLDARFAEIARTVFGPMLDAERIDG
jgi:exodeoxyribonuclease V gamma subunit